MEKMTAQGDIAFTLNLKEYIAVTYQTEKKKTIKMEKKSKKENVVKKRAVKSVKKQTLIL